MISKLMQINAEQETIIKRQAGIIDELFGLLCNHINLDEIEPLLTSMKDTAERTDKCRKNL